jgi:hypothetical protein
MVEALRTGAASSESQLCASVGGPTATRQHREIKAAGGVIQMARHAQGATYLEATRVRDPAGPQSMFLDRLQLDHDGTDILAANRLLGDRDVIVETNVFASLVPKLDRNESRPLLHHKVDVPR